MYLSKRNKENLTSVPAPMAFKLIGFVSVSAAILTDNDDERVK